MSLFLFIPYFIRAMLSKKCQKWGLRQKKMKGVWGWEGGGHTGGVCRGKGSNPLDTTIFTKCLPSNIYNFCVFVRKFNIFSCSDKLEMRKIDKLGDYLSSFYSAP